MYEKIRWLKVEEIEEMNVCQGRGCIGFAAAEATTEEGRTRHLCERCAEKFADRHHLKLPPLSRVRIEALDRLERV